MFYLNAPRQKEIFRQVSGALTNAEITKLCTYATTLPLQARNHSMRKSRFHLFDINDETKWLYNRLSKFMHDINHQYFGYDLTTIAEIQYTEYSPEYAGEFCDHLDWAPSLTRPRKLSISIQLSESNEYEGGDLQLQLGGNHTYVASRTKGDAFIFPAFLLHGVTPITKGIRRSLIIWSYGPEFR